MLPLELLFAIGDRIREAPTYAEFCCACPAYASAGDGWQRYARFARWSFSLKQYMYEDRETVTRKHVCHLPDGTRHGWTLRTRLMEEDNLIIMSLGFSVMKFYCRGKELLSVSAAFPLIWNISCSETLSMEYKEDDRDKQFADWPLGTSVETKNVLKETFPWLYLYRFLPRRSSDSQPDDAVRIQMITAFRAEMDALNERYHVRYPRMYNKKNEQ